MSEDEDIHAPNNWRNKYRWYGDFSFYCQWREVWQFRSWNWINFDLLSLSFEWGQYKGVYLEVRFAILGLVFQWEKYSDPELALAEPEPETEPA